MGLDGSVSFCFAFDRPFEESTGQNAPEAERSIIAAAQHKTIDLVAGAIVLRLGEKNAYAWKGG